MSRATTTRYTRGQDISADSERMRLSGLEIIALILIVLAIVTAAVAPSLLRTSDNPSSTKSIKVSQHDTLWEIAVANPVRGCTTAQTVQVILELNGMSESTIIAGQLLVVPDDAYDTPVFASN